MAALYRESPTSIQSALRLAMELLSRDPVLVEKGLERTEAELIVMRAAGIRTRLELYSRLEDRLQEAAGQKVIIWSQARSEGRTLQHLLGVQTFLEHEYEVGPDVLVPRPETEILVTVAMERITAAFPNPRLGLEIGLGSGVISIELLHRFQGLRMVATEASPNAIEVALRNSTNILGEREKRLKILQVQSELEVLEPFKEVEQILPADFLISNPPYLASTDEIDPDVRNNEPKRALFPVSGGPSYFYERIAVAAKPLLREDGMIFLELAAERAREIRDLFSRSNWDCEILADLNGRDRILVAIQAR